MRSFLLFMCFLVTLPLLGAVGHDIWHAMNDKDGLDFTKPFPFSALGWIWKTYDPDSLKWARDNVDSDFWKSYIAPVLEQKSVIVAGIPALCVYALTLFLKLFGIPPFEGEGVFSHRIRFGKSKMGGGSKDYSFRDDKKTKKTKYSRK